MVKRVLDVTLTLLVAPLAALASLVMASILAVELRGSPFFVQDRVGRSGMVFRIYKLRTMRHPGPGEEPRFRVDDFRTYVFSGDGDQDPRTTRWGAFARRHSLDELPNLVNVFRGEMSLVGPRPELPEIVAQYPAAYHRRHEVLGGITGLAQINGRSNLTYDETVSYDLGYVDRHSVRGDLQILWQTLVVVVRGSGAR